MKLIYTRKLFRQPNVHCEIDLCQISADGFVVNLRQGRVGQEWRESTRTEQAVTRVLAERIFNRVLAERWAQGFIDIDSEPEATPNSSPSVVAATTHIADAQLLARLVLDAWNKLPRVQKTRTIWRIGERRLVEAVPRLVALLEQGDAMQDYCLAYAIGRAGDPGALQAMQQLQQRTRSDAVRRMAGQAYWQLMDQAGKQAHADALLADWPAAIRENWQQQDITLLLSTIHTMNEEHAWRNLSYSDWLEQLDQVALVQSFARQLLLTLLKTIPLQAGVFRAIRHLYKYAEFRDDGELFGLLHQRFEQTPANAYNRNSPLNDVLPGVTFASEVGLANSRAAYNSMTRDYLRRRSWRTLRRLGEVADAAFIPMASGALLAMEDGTNPKHWMLYHRLLHAHGGWVSNHSGRTWQQVTTNASSTRYEAFPELWDAAPHVLLNLLKHSRCLGVHQFAVRALSDNHAYCAQLSIATLRELLHSRYAPCAQFALQQCRARFEADLADHAWLIVLLQSSLAEAHQYALDCILRQPDTLDAALLVLIICSPFEEVRSQGRMLCKMAESMAAEIILQLLEWLDNCNELPAACNSEILWLLDFALRNQAAQAPYTRLLDLLQHSVIEVQVLAGEWLLRHQQAVSNIPAPLLIQLIKSEQPALYGLGAKLFAALPEHVLLLQHELLLAFCIHHDAAVRRSIDLALQRLAQRYPDFALSLLPALLDSLFRSETSLGLHADILQWLQTTLRSATATLKRDDVVRLLLARSKGAQQLGAFLLPSFAASEFTVSELASLARNENLSVRQWAYLAYHSQKQRIHSQMEEALRIFDSRWEDSRSFAKEFFQGECTAEVWSANLLVNLCDHSDPDVQRFGREMLTRHFDVADVTEYMLKLSQHPSVNMQLFVSNWLESSASGNLANLQQLQPYFLSVLSQVNRGRVVKNRVLDFLRQQSQHSEAVAAFVAQLFARQVVTVAIADKAQYISALRDIQQRYPNIPANLTIHTPQLRSKGAPCTPAK